MKDKPRATSRTLFISLVVLLGLTVVSNAQHLIVSAPDGKSRLAEVVEIALAEARQRIPDLDRKIAENASTHEKLATQIDGDKLLIAVQIPAGGKLTIDFVSGEAPPPLVFGREATERKDDYAWENEYATYRVYGPALEATGEITSGIDVWSKRVPNLVIDRFYKRDAEGQRTHNHQLSYHVDDGVGLDSYEVGKSRGCGGTAVVEGGKLWVSKNYNHLKQISSGPVRFQFELTYAPWKAGDVEVTETKRITLDAGTHLNKIDSTFTFTGPSAIEAAAGIALHADASLRQFENGSILSDWDTPQDPTAGKIATGIIEGPKQKAAARQIDHQALLVFPVRSGQTFTYYAGSGWSKADMPTQDAWDAYLKQTKQQLDHPLQHHWEGKR
jgi:Domain of unknown function (DUF4861)